MKNILLIVCLIAHFSLFSHNYPQNNDGKSIKEVLVENKSNYSVKMAIGLENAFPQVYNFKPKETKRVEMPEAGKVTLCAYGYKEAYESMVAEESYKMFDRLCSWFYIPTYDFKHIVLNPDYRFVRASIKKI